MKKSLLFIFVLLICFAGASSGYSQSIYFKGHQSGVISVPYIQDSLQTVQLTGTIKNLTGNALNFKIFRVVNNMPAGEWYTQMCYDLCYSQYTDTIPLPGDQYTLNPNAGDSTSFYIDFTGMTQGLATTIVRVYNLANPNDYAQDTFKVQIGTTGIHQNSEIAGDYKLSQNYPNPFNPSTVINFTIPKSEVVTLKVFDAIGRERAVLMNSERLSAGNYNYDFDASGLNLTSGLYYYRLTAGNFTETRKMMLIK